MYHYTYTVYCKITNMIYYGKRTSKHPPEQDLWKEYFTSSKVIRRLRDLYGDDQFVCRVRKQFDSSNQALRWESALLRRCKVHENSRFINQWSSTDTIPGRFKGYRHSEDTKKRIAVSVARTKSTREIKRPDLSLRNRLFSATRGTKRPDISLRNSGASNGRARSVQTPLGTFETVRLAAIAHEVSEWRLTQMLKNNEDFKYV